MDNENETDLFCSNDDQRKRKSSDQLDSNVDESPEDSLTPTGRPKRRCTIGGNFALEEFANLEDGNAENDLLYEETSPEMETSQEPQPNTGIIIIDPRSIRDPDRPVGVLDRAKSMYSWMQHDEDTAKIRCRICIAVELRKWFISSTDFNLLESLKLHEDSEEHSRATGSNTKVNDNKQKPQPVLDMVTIEDKHQEPVATMSKMIEAYDPIASNGGFYDREVYCIPMECADPVPVPSVLLRNLLGKYGLKAQVKFVPNLTPAALREDISMAFRETFQLRTQELLQFDYLALSKDGKELTKPQKLLHFDGRTVLSFVGDSDVYILLKQKSPTTGINWKQILFQENQLRSLKDDEYKEVMLSVMHRLSSGKHKKAASDEQKHLVESLLGDYKLNNFHQLVYVGNGLDQLVLFTDKRREEAFMMTHADHCDLETTFKNIFKKYYWNGIVEWVSNRVKVCSGCLEKHGEEHLVHSAVPLDKIMSNMVQEPWYAKAQKQRTKQPSKQMHAIEQALKESPSNQDRVNVQTPKESPKQSSRLRMKDTSMKKVSTTSPKDVNPKHTKGTVNTPVKLAPRNIFVKTSKSGKSAQIAAAPAPMTTWIPVATKTVNTVQPKRNRASSIIPLPPNQLVPATNIRHSMSPMGSMTVPFVKKEPELLPPVEFVEPEESDRGDSLYEEDLEQAIRQNSKNTGDGSHCTNAMWSMYLLQQRGIYCDFFIMLLPSAFNHLKKPKIYGVHRIVFAAISGRIRKITKETIKIAGKVTCESLEGVIEFGYTGRVTGIQEIGLQSVTQVSTTAMALDIQINHYLQKQRPDFVKTQPKILITSNPPVDMIGAGGSGEGNSMVNLSPHGEANGGDW